ncbi:hypothetical protein G7Z17_g10056 [Cylindrodendrum hubeiense]|uniref:Uncharacterized protein n=1 Tax=Cylindrodendrum hubeiense TaxID=595255 RepID=A0A9P5LCQ0_9HYPO|nr:hypothetical protein G7Z17_g10056 [Cylindrodendrum hubeiense]
MQLINAILALSSLAGLTSAAPIAEENTVGERGYTFPADFRCKAACRWIDENYDTEPYCDTYLFTIFFDQCPSCAKTYNIWDTYSEAVEAAATKCGYPVPVPSASGTA